MTHPPQGKQNREDFLLRVLAISIREYLEAKDSGHEGAAAKLLENVRHNLHVFEHESSIPPEESPPYPSPYPNIYSMVQEYLGACPMCLQPIAPAEVASCSCRSVAND